MVTDPLGPAHNLKAPVVDPNSPLNWLPMYGRQGPQANSYFYPKLADFKANYATLLQLKGNVPANLKRAYDAIMRAGATIQAHLDAGITVSSVDFDNWLQTTKVFARQIGPLAAPQAQSLSDHAAAGQDQPGDSITQPVDQFGHWLWTEIEAAYAELDQVGSSMLGWVGLGVLAIVVLPMTVNELSRPARRRRHRKRA